MNRVRLLRIFNFTDSKISQSIILKEDNDISTS